MKVKNAMKLIYSFGNDEKEVKRPSKKAVKNVASLLILKGSYILILDDENHQENNLYVQTVMKLFGDDDFTSRYILESCFQSGRNRTMYRKTVDYEQLIRDLEYYYSGGVLWGSDRNDVTDEVFT